MPKETKDKAAITIWADKELTARLDKLAEKAGLTRSMLMKNMLEVSACQLEVMKTLGVLNTAVVFRDLKEKAKKWCEKESKMAAKKHAA